VPKSMTLDDLEGSVAKHVRQGVVIYLFSVSYSDCF